MRKHNGKEQFPQMEKPKMPGKFLGALVRAACDNFFRKRGHLVGESWRQRHQREAKNQKKKTKTNGPR